MEVPEAKGENADSKVAQVESNLKRATLARQTTLESIKTIQKEMDSLVKQRVPRPREKLSGLDERLKKLEHDRTIVSISLKEEKEILWQMSRVEKLKRQVEEFQSHDKKIKAKKAEISTLRDDLKKLSEQVSDLRLELSMAQKAQSLGCSVEELLGMQVECPPDMMGRIIGKKGQNVKQLQKEGNVSIDVVPNDGRVRITGSLQSLDATAMNIDRVLAVVEESMELAKPLLYYLTSKEITALAEIRSRQPDVQIEVKRSTGDVRFRGLPDDIESAKNDILSVDVVESTIELSAAESSLVVGKQGSTIIRLVENTQAAVEVTRGVPVEGSEEDHSTSTVTLRGSISAVKDATEEIEEILAQHKEEVESLPIDPLVQQLWLMNKGEGIQAVAKLVNEKCRDILEGIVLVNFEQKSVRIRAKSLVMPTAVEMVRLEIRLKESTITRISTHKAVIPVLIGKNGYGIQKLKEGAENVVVDANRVDGQISVCALDQGEMEKVVSAIQSFLVDHQVRVIQAKPDTFRSQFRILLRSKIWKELTQIVTVSRDDEKCAIVVRGKSEDLNKGCEILQTFLDQHFVNIVSITQHDVGALLRGGKESKIEKLAKENDVRLSVDSGKCVVEVIGKKENVGEAAKAVDRFLNGGEGVRVLRVLVDDASSSMLVGRGGSNKATLEGKFPNVSISIPPNNTVVLRGPDDDVGACEKHIAKLLVSSYITDKVVLNRKNDKGAGGAAALRGHLKAIPVITTIEDTRILVRGTRPDVQYALSVLKSKLGEKVEGRLFLDASQFKSLQSVGRESHIAHVQGSTGTKIGMEARTSSVTISGSRDDVRMAKVQLVQFLGFLFSDTFACEPVSKHAISLLGHPTQLGTIAEKCGSFLYIDRDLGKLVVSSSSPECVAKAKEVFAEKLAALEGMYHEVELGIDSEWLISKLIGKGGNRIKSLRKSLDVTIEMGDTSITLVSDDPAKLASAKEKFDEIVAQERAECYYVELPSESLSAFMGLKGNHVQEFEQQHDVRAQAMRKHTGGLRITGEAEAVAKAKTAFEEWLASQNEGKEDCCAMYEFDASETVTLTRLIGKNGKRINDLRRQCACTIEINVDKRYMKLVASDADSLVRARKIIDDVLEDERSQNVTFHLSENDMGAFIGAKGAHIREFEKAHGVRVYAMKSQAGALQISGNTEAVYKAKLALDFWISVRGKSPATDESNVEKKYFFDSAASRSSNPTTTTIPADQPPPAQSEFPALGPNAENAGIIETGGSSKSWASMLNTGTDTDVAKGLEGSAADGPTALINDTRLEGEASIIDPERAQTLVGLF